MKKRLILMRHAKSSWDFENLSDHERPLNKRGVQDAPKVGQQIAELGWEPQLVLCSTAKRTQETYSLMVKSFHRSPLICYMPSLYLASLGSIQEAIEFIHPQTDTVLLLGHNPGWSETQSWLSGSYVDFKTATAVLLSSKMETWQEAIQTPSSWKQKHIIHPKAL